MTSPSNLQLEQVAKKIVNSGMFFIPLLPNEKKNWDSDFLTRDYTEKDLIPNGNLGINPKKSKIGRASCRERV